MNSKFLRSIIVFSGTLIFALAFSAGAQMVTNEPFARIICISETRTNPLQRLFVAEVDLKNPRLHLRVVPGGPDPDGPGKWTTTLLQPTKVAARENFDLVVNGDFFVAKGVNDGEGTNSHFRAEQWARTSGLAMTDGKVWSASTNMRPCLVVHKNHSVTIETLSRPSADDWEIVSGNTMLVQNGVAVRHRNKVRNPRTVVGLDATGNKLIILVVDGRKPGVAKGMNYDELAAEMIRFGCERAMNLDGGGSSVLAVRAANGEMKILNTPTDGHERAVADVLGISVDKN